MSQIMTTIIMWHGYWSSAGFCRLCSSLSYQPGVAYEEMSADQTVKFRIG